MELKSLRHQQVEVNAFHYTRCMSTKSWRRATELISEMFLFATRADIYCFNGAAHLSGKDHWMIAVSLLRSAQGQRQRLDEYSVGIMARSLQDRKWQAALHTVSAAGALSTGLSFKNDACSFALNAMATASKWQCMLVLWDLGPSNLPSTLEANIALRVPSEDTQWAISLEMFMQMPGGRVAPDLFSFNTLLGKSPWRFSSLCLQQLQEMNLQGDGVTYNSISTVASQAQCWRSSLAALFAPGKSLVTPPASLAAAVSWRWANQLFDEMTMKSLEVDCSFATATSSSIVEGHWPLSLHVAGQPQKDDVLGLNALLAAASRGTLWKGALELTAFGLEHRWQMDDFGCSLVLSAMNADHLYERWQQALELIVASVPKAQSYSISTLLASMKSWQLALWLASSALAGFLSAAIVSTVVTRCGTWRQALQLWRQSPQELHEISNCNAVISRLDDGKQWEDAAWLAHESMRSNQLELDRVSQNPLMNRRWQDALKYIGPMDEVTLSTLLRWQPWHLCLHLLKSQSQLRVVADETSYNACTSSLLCSQHWRHILELCNSMLQRSLAATRSAVSLHAAAAACSQRHDHLPKILVQMNWAAMRSLSTFHT